MLLLARGVRFKPASTPDNGGAVTPSMGIDPFYIFMSTLYFRRKSHRPRRRAIFLVTLFAISAFMLAFRPFPAKLLARTPQQVTAARSEWETALVGQMKTVDAQLVQAQEAISVNSAIPAQFQGQILPKIDLQSGEKVVALTFDDGPWTHTPEVLDILKKFDIKATFFVIGRHIASHQDALKRLVKEGHAVGNHTWNHHYHNVSAQTAAAELGQTADLVKEVTGVETVMFRPPGGNLTNGLVDYATGQNYFVAMWSVDSRDYTHTTAAAMTERVLRDAHSGAMVLFHDGGGDRTATVEALPQIIGQLQKQGYRFVTVPELLELKARESKPKINPSQG